MLTAIALTNYRGFSDHRVELRPVSVVVGRNNAGKSTIVEALRLVSLVTERIGGLGFREPPEWTGLPRRLYGVRPSLDGIGIDFTAICHRYADPPAAVSARFLGGESIAFYVNQEGEGYAVLSDDKGEVIRSKRRVHAIQFPTIHVLPQVAPLEAEEMVLTDPYVRRHLSSPLASRHFRNQLRLLSPEYVAFRTIAEETWPGLQVRTLRGAKGFPGSPLFLDVRDRDFVGEVGRMGHGLQMWLQTMWFLARTPPNTTVVLDEPDVYMHADLQRRLMRLVKGRFEQVLVATHSIEIMAEVAPSEVLIVDRDQAESQFADSDPAVQDLIERLGGIHNVQLARLWGAKRCLLFEGKDLAYLKLVHDLLYPGADPPLDDLPHSTIGGWGGWQYAIGSSLFVKNAMGEDIAMYCVLDSDYHTRTEIRKRLRQAKDRNVRLYVWKRKEIENYFLAPAAIARVISAKGRKGPLPIPTEVVIDELERTADGLRLETQDDLGNELFLEAKDKGTQAAHRRAREMVEKAFSSFDGKLAVVSGKRVFKGVARWAQKEFGVSMTVSHVIREMRMSEVPTEVKLVIGAIHESRTIEVEKWDREWV